MGTTNYPGNFNDLVFENRFKQYGAYALRKTYSDRLVSAAIIGISTFALLIGTSFVMQQGGSSDPFIPKDNGNTIVPDSIVIDITPKNPEDHKTEEPQEKPKTQKGFDMNYQADEEERETDDKKLVDLEFKPGTPDGEEDTIPEYPEPSYPPIYVDPPPPLTFVEKWPAFNGDLGKWLGDHLVYPAYAKDAGIQGTVHLSFVVDEEGNVSDIKVLRDIGGGCAESAINAVKQMPKWKPGIQGGKPVRVLYTQKIKFTLHQ